MFKKAPFSIPYTCNKCGLENVKLWRGVHGAQDSEGHELKCAKCLAPDLLISNVGKGKCRIRGKDGWKDLGMESDQLEGWLPAIPVGDTYWGYSSVPSADVSWWRALPTYPFNSKDSEIAHLRDVLKEETAHSIDYQDLLMNLMKRRAI